MAFAGKRPSEETGRQETLGELLSRIDPAETAAPAPPKSPPRPPEPPSPASATKPGRLLYGVAIFLGAFLLFSVQPLVGKYLLPWFGGSTSVWTTCLVFFQVLLLGGYAYAHGISRRLRPRTQAGVHLSLLALAFLLCPVAPPPSWKPEGGENPLWALLGILAGAVGLPFLLLAATSPLLQS